MLENIYFKQVRAALAACGVWGHASRVLIEELQDHFHASVRGFLEEGHSLQKAEGLAIERLGKPRMVARSAALELRERTVVGRHPWLILGFGLTLGLIVLFFAIIFGLSLFARMEFSRTGEVSNPIIIAAKLTEALANWLPFFFGILFIAAVARLASPGWRALMIAALAVGIGTSGFTVQIPIPAAKNERGFAYVGGQTWLYLGVYLTTKVHPAFQEFPEPWYRVFTQGASWFRFCFPFLCCGAIWVVLRRRAEQTMLLTR